MQRRGDDGLLAAHRSGRERRVLQIQRVLFGPQVEKLGKDSHMTHEISFPEFHFLTNLDH